MKIGELKQLKLVDEGQKVVIIAFDGHNEHLYFKGHFGDLPDECLTFDINEIGSLERNRELQYGKYLLGIFINF